MSFWASVVIYFPIVVLICFLLVEPRKSVMLCFLGGWLFLPVGIIRVQGFLDLSKDVVVPLSVLIACLVFDRVSVLSPLSALMWADALALIWCICPLASSYSNSLGFYDGMSAMVARGIQWGIPYCIGRAYFRTLPQLRELAVWVFGAGVMYSLLCLYEIRMSPGLHKMLYGYHQHMFAETKRFGGWRPMVFMNHGLMVGLWMASSSLCGLWLAKSGLLVRFAKLPAKLVVCWMLIVTILCKSLGSLVILAAMVLAILVSRWGRRPFALLVLGLLPPLYVSVRCSGMLKTETATAFVAPIIAGDRLHSFRFRLENEDLLLTRAWQRPVLGWAGWNRNRVHDSLGHDITITDGLWIIALGQNGFVGLVSLVGLLLSPALHVYLRSVRNGSREAAPALALSGLVTMFAIDSLFNAMPNPIMLISAGAALNYGGNKKPGTFLDGR